VSKGLGKVQREIINLCVNVGYAWALEELCYLIYPDDDDDPFTRAEKVAISRAIRRMTLPGTWVFERMAKNTPGGGCWWLYDPCNLHSATRAYMNSYDDQPAAIERQVAKAQRWRDASEAERLDIEIEEIEHDLRMSKMFDKLGPMEPEKRVRRKPGQTFWEADEERRSKRAAEKRERDEWKRGRDREAEERLAALRRKKAELTSANRPMSILT
jgi:hypothetical protein